MRTGIQITVNQDFARRLARAAELGFTCGQLLVWDMSLYENGGAQRIRALLEEYHFHVSAVWCGWSGPRDWSYPGMYETLGLVPGWLRAQRMGELLRGAAFARELGVDTIVTHTGYIPDNPLDPTHRAVVLALRHICGELERQGQVFTFETGEELPLTLVQMIVEIGKPNVGVNFDPANLLINARANPTDALRLLLPYVRGVHAKDGVYPAGTNPKGRETPIGQGMVDFRTVIRLLLEAGYAGDLTIEREIPEGAARDRDIIEAKAYLDALIREEEAHVRQ